VHDVVAEAAKVGGIEFPVHPHMLRHGTGFYLANAGQDTHAIQLYLGRKEHSAYDSVLRIEFRDLAPGSGVE
jgi:site-specific recombinase XerD